MAADRTELLLERVRRDRNCCPVCGSRDVRRITRHKAVVADRECRHCSCLWSPPWTWGQGLFAAIAGFAFAVPLLMVAAMVVWNLCTGQAPARRGPATFEDGMQVIVAILLLGLGPIVFLHLGWYGIGVLRGRKGKPLIRRIDPAKEAIDDGRP